MKKANLFLFLMFVIAGSSQASAAVIGPIEFEAKVVGIETNDILLNVGGNKYKVPKSALKGQQIKSGALNTIQLSPKDYSSMLAGRPLEDLSEKQPTQKQ